MKKHLLTISAVLAAVVAAQAADKTLTVTVTNPSKTERRAVPVVIEVDDDVRSALVTLDGKEIPCQLDDLDDDGEFDELAFVTDMAKKEKQTFTVTLSEQGEPRKYENRTYGYLGIRDRSEKNQKHQRKPGQTAKHIVRLVHHFCLSMSAGVKNPVPGCPAPGW